MDVRSDKTCGGVAATQHATTMTKNIKTKNLNREAGDVDVRSAKCRFPACNKTASFGPPPPLSRSDPFPSATLPAGASGGNTSHALPQTLAQGLRQTGGQRLRQAEGLRQMGAKGPEGRRQTGAQGVRLYCAQHKRWFDEDVTKRRCATCNAPLQVCQLLVTHASS